MAGANEEKAARQSSAAEEAPVSIVTYTEDEMVTFKESITSLEQKYSYSFAFILSM